MLALRVIDEIRPGDRLTVANCDEVAMLEPRIELDARTWAGRLVDLPPEPRIDVQALVVA